MNAILLIALLMPVKVEPTSEGLVVKASAPEQGYYSDWWIEGSDVQARRLSATEWVFKDYPKSGTVVLVVCSEGGCHIIETPYAFSTPMWPGAVIVVVVVFLLFCLRMWYVERYSWL